LTLIRRLLSLLNTAEVKALERTGLSYGLGLMMVLAAGMLTGDHLETFVFGALATGGFLLGWQSLTRTHGWRVLALGLVILGLFVIVMRNRELHVTTPMPIRLALILCVLGMHLWAYRITSGPIKITFQTLTHCALALALTLAAGAHLSGQAQASGITALLLLLTQLFVWVVFGARAPLAQKSAAILFASIIPLMMNVSFAIGHGLAIPLLLSQGLGTVLLWHIYIQNDRPPRSKAP
jgi:hypothetical protein